MRNFLFVLDSYCDIVLLFPPSSPFSFCGVSCSKSCTLYYREVKRNVQSVVTSRLCNDSVYNPIFTLFIIGSSDVSSIARILLVLGMRKIYWTSNNFVGCIRLTIKINWAVFHNNKFGLCKFDR